MNFVLSQYPDGNTIRANLYKIEKTCSIEEAKKLYNAINMPTELASNAYCMGRTIFTLASLALCFRQVSVDSAARNPRTYGNDCGILD